MKFEIGEYRTKRGTVAVISTIAEGQEYPFIGYCYDSSGMVFPESWGARGNRFELGREDPYDLVLPKVTIWINVWKNGYTEAYNTKEAADNDIFDGLGGLRAGCIEYTFED